MTNFLNHYSLKLILILFIKSAVILLFIVNSELQLSPDEAQYWTWSQSLDFGYYSKPPGIAWEIAAGTTLFGNSLLGIRIFAVFFSFCLSLLLYCFALSCSLRPKAAFWVGLIMTFCPIGIFGSIFAITDGGLLFFWSLSALIAVKSFSKEEFPPIMPLGFSVALGGLFKWSIYLFWPCLFLIYLLSLPIKKWIWPFLGALLISSLAFLPTIWWNWHHEWATFRHVGSTIVGGHGGKAGNFLELIGSQMLLLSPLFFSVFVMGCLSVYLKKIRLPLPLFFCFSLSLITFFPLAFLSLFQKMQGNWLLFVYPTAIVFLVWFALEEKPAYFKWLKIGLGVNFILIFLVLLWPNLNLFYRYSPFKHNLGWKELEKGLVLIGYNEQSHFLLSDRYQTTSILSFYSPQKKRAYFLNVEGQRKNQFSYWPNFEDEEKEKVGIFVWVENSPHLVPKNLEEKKAYYLKELSQYFEEVSLTLDFPLLATQEEVLKRALFFECKKSKKFQKMIEEKY